MEPTFTNKESRSFGELFSELTRETTTLIRQELRLAKTEFSEKAAQARTGLVWIVVGGLIAFLGLEALVVAAIIGLAYLVQWWLAALIVGVIVCLIGLILIGHGRESLKAENLALNRTMETLEEDKQWAKAQMR